MPKSTAARSSTNKLGQIKSGVIHRLRRGAGGLVHAAGDLVFPPMCTFCGDTLPEVVDDVHLCASCRAQFIGEARDRCLRCAALLRADFPSGRHCDRCRALRLRFDEAVALETYEGPLRAAILRMKQPRYEPLAAAMGDLLCSTAEERLASYRPDVVVPIPMHWFRRLRRGTNDAEVVAASIAKRLGFEILPALYRCRNTKPHSGLLPRERFANVRGAFNLRAGYDLKATRVLLVDDIMTVGATCSEAARVLKQHGARWVGVAVVGRTEFPD